MFADMMHEVILPLISLTHDDPLSKLSEKLEVYNYVVIKFSHEEYDEKLTKTMKPIIFGIITSIDLLDFVIKNKPDENGVGGNELTCTR
ncbi:unnamed protein product [Didymodactylos carnosus]|uniref:CBS domain-containing protein n=1 Tax=Didymodactylos carnosus TaxID=1234261 RepID=A0A8S2SL97_9BILA|nr:unnamed protein product [Didymodactylos carnosus]CAF4228166.1 unnamed protein product [Didymodactylos carnosus]